MFGKFKFSEIVYYGQDDVGAYPGDRVTVAISWKWSETRLDQGSTRFAGIVSFSLRERHNSREIVCVFHLPPSFLRHIVGNNLADSYAVGAQQLHRHALVSKQQIKEERDRISRHGSICQTIGACLQL